MTVGERRGLTHNRLESSRVCECDLEEEERVEIPFPFSAKFDIPVTNTTGTTSNIQLSDSNQARLAKPYVSMTVKRPLETVTCFKCGEKGHYANTCPKSFRAQQMGLVGTQQQIAANVGVK
jgi:hypothetical protein